MAKVTHLRYVGISVPAFEQEVGFYSGIWGLKLVEKDKDIAFLAAEGSPEQYILRVRSGPDKRLDVVGFGAADRAAVDRLAEELVEAGVKLISEPARLQTPGGGYGFRFFDCDGRVVEVSSDVEPRPYREIQPEEGIPVKLSHVVLNSPDVERTKAFYEQMLGFRLSDWLLDIMCFLRCNPEHHCLAIIRGPYPSLNHVSFEMRGLDEFMRGAGRLMRRGYRLIWGPGRHGAGNNTFAYFLDPNANVCEYTTELERIYDEESYQPRVWSMIPEEVDRWGTANTDPMLYNYMSNSPDRGLWTPPPI
ncbi:Metapyrocatechase [bacterium HR24]|nr:Metapyrocatechase [bacterium HR24]